MSGPADRHTTKRGVGLALLALVLMLIPASGATAPPTERVIVVLEDWAGPPADAATDAEKAFGGRLLAVYEHALRGFAIEVPSQAVAGLERIPGVAWVEPDITISIAQTGEAQPLPTHLDRIESDLNPPVDPVPVNIAIIDTGIQLDHPDLYVRAATNCTGAIFYPLFGGCTSSGTLGDENGHGTHVAGLAAACDNEIGTIGSAPCAQVTSIKVLDATGSGPLSGILAGLDTVAANASWIDVANASWGFEGGSQALTDSVNGVIASGVVFVAAAGNSAQEISTFAPANVPDAVTVTAVADFDGKPGGQGAATCRTDVDDTLADFSNYGAGADIAAPGVCLFSTWLNSGYAVASGTSMASPVVAGAAARYIAENGKPTNRAGVLAVRDALVSGGFDQSGDCGFADVDGIAEPLVSANGSAFGGPGGCESAVGGNQPPVAAFTYDCNDLLCTFDATASTDDSGIQGYDWSFGAGAGAAGVTTSHDFAGAGEYAVTLTVTDAGSLSDSITQNVTVSIAPPNRAPIADFTVGCPDLNCTFDAGSSSDPDGTITGWSWTFGDGATSTAPAPAHGYSNSGIYDVTLVVTDDDGVDSDAVTQSVTVVNGTPTAAFSLACEGLACSVDAGTSSDDGGVVSYAWGFGDGVAASGVTASHTYAAPGDYLVTLTVTDGEGAQGIHTQTATATEAEPLTMTTANIGYLWDDATREATVLLSITGSDLQFVAGAQVTGHWTWLNRGGSASTLSVSTVSDAGGLAEIVTTFKKNQTPIEFCVTDVVAAGYVYVPFEPTCAGEYPGG